MLIARGRQQGTPPDVGRGVGSPNSPGGAASGQATDQRRLEQGPAPSAFDRDRLEPSRSPGLQEKTASDLDRLAKQAGECGNQDARNVFTQLSKSLNGSVAGEQQTLKDASDLANKLDPVAPGAAGIIRDAVQQIKRPE